MSDRSTVIDDRRENPSLTPSGEKICPECGGEYSGLGVHLAKSSSCSYPQIGPRQREVLTGILLVCGSIIRPKEANARIEINVRQKPIAEWIQYELGWIYNSTEKREDGEVFDSGQPGESYRVRTITHPQFGQWFDSWNKEEQRPDRERKYDRQIPGKVDITPRALRAAYVAKGWLEKGYPVIGFGTTRPTPERLENVFSRFDPKIRGSPKREENKSYNIRIRRTDRFFNEIGWNPVQGRSDIWPATP